MESELDAARRALETAPPHRVAAARRKVSRLERRLAGLRPEETA
jgi:hypothetical protein